MKITAIHQTVAPISSDIRNAVIDFSKMTASAVAVVTDVKRNGKRVIGYGFNSNGRYAQSGLLRERFVPRIMGADPATLLDDAGANLDPHRIWACMMANEKPGGHGDRTAGDRTMVMGDLTLTEPQVNPTMSAALENGLEVTALHNHFFFDEPKVYFMHIGGMGNPEKLAAAVKGVP